MLFTISDCTYYLPPYTILLRISDGQLNNAVRRNDK